MLISYSNHYFKYLYWVPKPLIGYFEEALHVGIAFRVGSSRKVT
jgi:hypothetical protein